MLKKRRQSSPPHHVVMKHKKSVSWIYDDDDEEGAYHPGSEAAHEIFPSTASPISSSPRRPTVSDQSEKYSTAFPSSISLELSYCNEKAVSIDSVSLVLFILH